MAVEEAVQVFKCFAQLTPTPTPTPTACALWLVGMEDEDRFLDDGIVIVVVVIILPTPALPPIAPIALPFMIPPLLLLILIELLLLLPWIIPVLLLPLKALLEEVDVEAQVTMDEVMLLRDSSATIIIIIIIVCLFCLYVYDLNFVCAFNELITITVRVFVVWCGVVVLLSRVWDVGQWERSDTRQGGM